MISVNSIVDAAKIGITPFNPTGAGEGNIYEAKIADENYYPVTISISGGLKLQKSSANNCTAVFIQQVTDFVALGKVRKEQIAYTDQLQGCIWEIWKDHDGNIYGAHAYKALNKPAKTIEGTSRFKNWKLVQRFETAGKANADQHGMVMAFSSVGSNIVETAVIALDKSGKYSDLIETRNDSIK